MSLAKYGVLSIVLLLAFFGFIRIDDTYLIRCVYEGVMGFGATGELTNVDIRSSEKPVGANDDTDP